MNDYIKLIIVVLVVSLIAKIIYDYIFKLNPVPPFEACPTKWDRPNSPTCPEGYRTSTTNKCECEVCVHSLQASSK
jgi:hypothetical protein